LHRQKFEKDKQNVDAAPHGKNSADAHGHGPLPAPSSVCGLLLSAVTVSLHHLPRWLHSTATCDKTLTERKLPENYVCKTHIFWLSQWLLFATTNKRYAAFFSFFLQLPIHRETASLSQKQNITELLQNRPVPD